MLIEHCLWNDTFINNIIVLELVSKQNKASAVIRANVKTLQILLHRSEKIVLYKISNKLNSSAHD